METPRSTLPWECDLNFKLQDGCLMIEDNDGCNVALIPDACIYGESIQRDHAAFIVRACNTHDELCAMLDLVKPYCTGQMQRQINALLDRALGIR